ncbi:hypothetical protein BGZ74_001664 [Mortierella antarctica]|nr:hypothetical protein BGZ74_001664 [Mortierella antarctica]
MKFQTILLVAAALMITYVQATPIDIVEQPDVDPNDQKAKCGYDMMICLRGHKIFGKSSLLGGLAVFSSSQVVTVRSSFRYPSQVFGSRFLHQINQIQS